ncbi:MAG: hypothetical protein JSW39_29355 [Desulfobacterales bacterium]|nr:MAG: hypothetical protein JSW39_29355 [Desulfobacterales bacterium]
MEDESMDSRPPTDKEEEKPPTDLDWENRILCSDESCIGVIGPDGRCKECGKKYEGSLPEDFLRVPDEADQEDEPTAEEPEAIAEEPGMGETAELDAELDIDWENRKLCSDGNCIGVIGPDGRCKVCGKPDAD